MADRKMLVPEDPVDILESVEKTFLPRSMAESVVIVIDFKWMNGVKNNHHSGLVRPVKMMKTLAFLKDIGNPYYQDVILQFMLCKKQFQDGEDILHYIEQCYLNAQTL